MKTLSSFKLLIGAVVTAGLQTAAYASSVAEPFAYPESLVAGRPVEGKPVTQGIRIGSEEVTLESTPIRDLAKKLHFSLMREGDGDYTRDWTCLTTGSGSDDFSIWLIATGSPAVTEAQMASNGLSPRGKGTGPLLKGSEKNASIGGITPGMTWNQVLAKFGQPTYAADDDWYFWSTSKTIEEFSNSREQMNWTGVQLEKGRVSRLFSSQATNP